MLTSSVPPFRGGDNQVWSADPVTAGDEARRPGDEGSEPEDAHPPIPKELLVPLVYDKGWPEQHHCPFVVPMYHAETGAYASPLQDSDRWGCQRCAPKKVAPILQSACRHFQKAERVWCGRFWPFGENTLTALRKRRQRANKAAVLWVRRGVEHQVFSTADLAGDDLVADSAEWRDPVHALKLLHGYSLGLPGVDKVGDAGARKKPQDGEETKRRRSNWRAPLGITSVRAGDHIEKYILERRTGASLVADGAIIDPRDVDNLIREAYRDFQQSRRESDV